MGGKAEGVWDSEDPGKKLKAGKAWALQVLKVRVEPWERPRAQSRCQLPAPYPELCGV